MVNDLVTRLSFYRRCKPSELPSRDFAPTGYRHQSTGRGFLFVRMAAQAVPRGQVIFQSVPGGISAAMFAWNTDPYLARRTITPGFLKSL